MNNTIYSLEGSGYRSMKVISAPTSRDKLSSHRHDFEIMSADVACTPKIFRNRRRVVAEVEERDQKKSRSRFPLFTSDPAALVTRRYPKVVSRAYGITK